ncbi:hypothetical protein FA15DRAFT_663758 [Coprinopsis marcescibilis]|uniref:EXS domain-containing protein n=1 Tax=Coprinopsis marcescibilis TaxID=230819 RepID=A0A5C3L9A5_COPMA|nr:hypothetical protein FA15DRAFT_663758 [Coprinopsis marcescibilis]
MRKRVLPLLVVAVVPPLSMGAPIRLVKLLPPEPQLPSSFCHFPVCTPIVKDTLSSSMDGAIHACKMRSRKVDVRDKITFFVRLGGSGAADLLDLLVYGLQFAVYVLWWFEFEFNVRRWFFVREFSVWHVRPTVAIFGWLSMLYIFE